MNNEMIKKPIKKIWVFIIGIGFIGVVTLISFFLLDVPSIIHKYFPSKRLLISPYSKEINLDELDKIEFPLRIMNTLDEEKKDVVILISISPKLSKFPGLILVPDTHKETSKKKGLSFNTRSLEYRWDENNLSFILR